MKANTAVGIKWTPTKLNVEDKWSIELKEVKFGISYSLFNSLK